MLCLSVGQKGIFKNVGETFYGEHFSSNWISKIILFLLKLFLFLSFGLHPLCLFYFRNGSSIPLFPSSSSTHIKIVHFD